MRWRTGSYLISGHVLLFRWRMLLHSLYCYGSYFMRKLKNPLAIWLIYWWVPMSLFLLRSRIIGFAKNMIPNMRKPKMVEMEMENLPIKIINPQKSLPKSNRFSDF